MVLATRKHRPYVEPQVFYEKKVSIRMPLMNEMRYSLLIKSEMRYSLLTKSPRDAPTATPYGILRQKFRISRSSCPCPVDGWRYQRWFVAVAEQHQSPHIQQREPQSCTNPFHYGARARSKLHDQVNIREVNHHQDR